jgi:hypothetical protein
MAYSKSLPFKNFLTEIDEIIKVIRKVSLRSNSSLDSTFKEYILSSSVFLAHAEIENYIQDIFNLYLRSLSQKKFFDLNEDLRSFLVYKFVKDNNIHHSLLANDEKSIMSIIKKEASNGHKHIFDKDLQITYISGKSVYETYKYPSTKNIQKIYKRIGCDNIFNLVSQEIRKNAKNILERIGTYRTSLAHTATLSNMASNDLIFALNELKLFVKGLDKVLYKRIVADYQQIFWRTHLH